MPIIEPYSKISIGWAGFMLLVDIIYTAFWVPINVAFCTSNFGGSTPGCRVPDLLGGEGGWGLWAGLAVSQVNQALK